MFEGTTDKSKRSEGGEKRCGYRAEERKCVCVRERERGTWRDAIPLPNLMSCNAPFVIELTVL